jgi:hypothetical protein
MHLVQSKVTFMFPLIVIVDTLYKQSPKNVRIWYIAAHTYRTTKPIDPRCKQVLII